MFSPMHHQPSPMPMQSQTGPSLFEFPGSPMHAPIQQQSMPMHGMPYQQPMNPSPQPKGGFLSRLFKRSGGSPSIGNHGTAFNSNPSFGFGGGGNPTGAFPQAAGLAGAAGATGAAAATTGAATGGGFMGFINNAQKVIGVAQQVGPMVQQYGPLVRSAPALYQMFKGSSGGQTNPAETTNEEATPAEPVSNTQPSKSLTATTSTKSNHTPLMTEDFPLSEPVAKKNTVAGMPGPKLYV
ncbi:YqfQ family protein [Bacillus sp. FJAT-45350]|uniref:YqfQ family protein n=1 Tax=Bacillus sp. FJAT-45350 TaxID=2011014 RepID=UPI00211BC0E2|nr:YqfQ family protein [Bacillus sp. FJAT-45350]